ncbi:DUF4395 domain-containing protein [Sulfurimonas microaerophilic]|uniref:DUF4395 domain-containing protein n=1 Tax=Sulfurimonas microaerophilic TaxID=3058392 RepID=UPI0027154295|nr:DUF4395 domain-containing protein [Sulfurimonas sp. hsl 1-7]
MNLPSFLNKYGEEVPGYDVRVINEREARAAAGILGTLGIMVIFIGIGFNHIIVARVYIAFLWFEFLLRITKPSYAPSLLLARFFVQNQTPEYVGAAQKRFAWAIGWFISFPMIYWFVLNWDITFYKVLICVLCAALMFFESAFSICLGCMLYKYIKKEDPQYCPGGVCEVRKKEPIQTFNLMQKIIAGVTAIGLVVGIYLFLAYTEPKTFFGDFLHEAVLTDAQLQAQKDAAYEKEMAAEFGDEDEEE